MKRSFVLGVLLVAAAIVAVLWIVPGLSTACCSPPGAAIHDAETSAPVPVTEPQTAVPPRPADAFPLTVDYVFDGDTIEASPHSANAVLPTTEPVRIRLIGIDTPEGTPSPECWADEAREHLRTLLPDGATVWAAPDVELRDRYDRALLYLWTDDGRFVNHELVAAGDAEALIVEPNDAHYPLMLQAEASARESGAGQWSACG